MFTVLGSGFGLYGYVPALLHAFPDPVILPAAYRAKVEAREELRRHLGRILWAPDAQAALEAATGAVIATIPAQQPDLVARCCAAPRVERLMLEKPLAATPAEADRLLARIGAAGKRYRVGYTLLQTEWAARLRWPRERAGVIDWTFMAHHFAHDLANWKREAAQGGGAIRFFGVHLLALLARHGYDAVAMSRTSGPAGAPERWEAELSGPGLGAASIRLDSRASSPRFAVAFDGEAEATVSLGDPFELEVAQPLDDRRVPVLARLLETFAEEDAPFERLYRTTQRLWAQAEEKAA